MAELLGVVAGGIGIASFAIQIGDSVVKLKRFISSMREAPEEVRSIIHNIDVLKGILESISTYAKDAEIQDGEDDNIAKSLISCQGAAEYILKIAKEIEQSVKFDGRKGRLRFALKQAALESLASRLEQAKITILLAQSARTQYVIF